MTVEERAAYLSAQCAADDDVELRAEVDRLLSAHADAGRFIEQSPVAAASSAVEATRDGVMTGRVVGRYQIGRRIGIGGMGHVYAARDLELGREVALKVAIDNDHESHARLRREAQQASRLNHARICTIHEIGSVDGKPFIAMELIEGPTLADRIAGGPLTLDEAMRIARQLIEALDEAHMRGVIHRDFKPANVKVRPDSTVKVLDFGLAKTAAAIAPDADATSPVTRAGMIVGTPAYMAPEQVQGKPIDKRVDIWAFGCVLYEMVTGEPPFRGETISDLLAAVLTADPVWDRVPPSLQGLLRRCLERDPTRRLRDIGDATALLDTAPSASAAPAHIRHRREWWAWSAAALLLITTLGVLAINRRSTSPPPLPEVQFDISAPDGYTLVPFSVAPSSDGRSIAYLAEAERSGDRALWIYTVASGASRAVVTLDRAGALSNPFWSPDGRSIGIFGAGKIRRVDVTTGMMETVCDSPGGIGRGSWNSDDVIIFGVRTGDGNEGLLRVPASGGTPVQLTRTDRAHQQRGHSNPTFLPDGRFFVYQALIEGDQENLYLGSIDASPEAQASTPLLTARGVVRYTPSPDPKRGYLLYMRDGKLMAQPFDNQQRRVDGQAVIVPRQGVNELTSREFAGAADLLTYRHLARPNGSLVWIDRHGRETPALGGAELEAPEYPRFSPDGRRLALALNGDLWVYDLSGRPPIKLTFEGTSFSPLWTRDGRRLIFESPGSLKSIAADGTDRDPQPASRDGHYHPHGWTGEGELVGVRFFTGFGQIVTFPATSTGEPRPLVNMRTGGEEAPALSPDGHWLAYAALTTGRSEIWVQPFPTGPPTRVSGRGGTEPLWSRNGHELFYLEDQKLMSVAVKTGERFLAAEPVVLFEGPYLHQAQPPSYDMAPDGRFLMIKPARGVQAPITAVFNWTAAIRPSSPTK